MNNQNRNLICSLETPIEVDSTIINQSNANNQDILIMKFGGSCLSSPEGYQRIYEICNQFPNRLKFIIISAISGTTDLLNEIVEVSSKFQEEKQRLNIFKQKIQELINKILTMHIMYIETLFPQHSSIKVKLKSELQNIIDDISSNLDEIEDFGYEKVFIAKILGTGEKLSALILLRFFELNQVKSFHIPAEILIVTDDNFLNANPNLKLTSKRLQRILNESNFKTSKPTHLVIPGFIGTSKTGLQTTLGRGGSDYTTTIIAKSIKELHPEIPVGIIFWKDVDGILTGNPKHVDHPILIPRLSFHEAKELAYFGAKILHPKCLKLVEKMEIPIQIRNFNQFNSSNFTEICKEPENYATNIIGISSSNKMGMISIVSEEFVNVPGILGRIFTILGNNQINVRIISQSSSEINTTILVEESQAIIAVNLLKKDQILHKWFRFEYLSVGVVAVIGDNVNCAHHLVNIYKELARFRINPLVISQGSDHRNLTLVVSKEQLKLTANALNELFFWLFERNNRRRQLK